MSAPASPTIAELANGGRSRILAEILGQFRRVEDALAGGGSPAGALAYLGDELTFETETLTYIP